MEVKSLTPCGDGKYRWRYEINLYKYPWLFLLVWRIVFFVFFGVFLFTALVDMNNHDFFWESFLMNGKVFLIIFGVMTAVAVIGYILYAAIMGGKYIVDFTMDENGILHKQAPAQAKKAKALGKLTSLLGAASGKPTIAGIGLNSTVTEMYSDFNKVRKIKAYPKRNLIKLNSFFEKNQVYADKDNFTFILTYIKNHTEKR